MAVCFQAGKLHISQEIVLAPKSIVIHIKQVRFTFGMSQSDLQDRNRGRYGHFSTDRGAAILNVDHIFFYIRAQFVAELRCACNITLANLWINCLQCGDLSLKARNLCACVCVCARAFVCGCMYVCVFLKYLCRSGSD